MTGMSKLLAHCFLDQSNDDHKDNTAYATTGEPAYNVAAPTKAEHTDNLRADSAANNAHDRVPERTKTEFFKDETAEIAANGSANETDNSRCHI